MNFRILSVTLLLISWKCIEAEKLENISIESVLDQVAIPTGIINKFFDKPLKKESSPNQITLEKQEVITLEKQDESSTIHYENSNGFVPLIVSKKPYESKQKKTDFDNSDRINDTIIRRVKDDPILSPEARMLSNLQTSIVNRRSFQGDDSHNEFELLKVNNGTPAVANYNAFYQPSKEESKSGFSHFNTTAKKSFRNKDRDRGKRIQSYLGSYDDMINEDDDKYSSTKIRDSQPINVVNQQASANYYNRDNGNNYRTLKTTLPNTNFASITTPKSTNKVTNAVKSNGYSMNMNEQSMQSGVSTPSPYSATKKQIELQALENEKLSQDEGTNRNYESADSRDFSDEGSDYMDEGEKSRRSQKTKRRRPTSHFDSSRKLPKEHRDMYDDVYDDRGRKRPNTRSKTKNRQNSKPTQVMNEDDQYDNDGGSVDSTNNNYNQHSFSEGNTWNQITPNVEVSHSNGFELNQIEKPKLHMLPVNVLTNFDHATALDNSQGFDISNAMFTGFVHEGSLVSTASPLVSSSPNYVDQNLIPSSTVKPQIGISTPVPDIIVGQSSFHNPVQAVFMPNKLQQSMLNQYVQSTIAPALFAVTPRPGFAASSTVVPNIQMLNQASFPLNQQLYTAQSNGQSFANHQQSAYGGSSSEEYNNDYHNQNRQQHSKNRPDIERAESQYKKKFNGNSGQFLASASLSVGQGNHRQSQKNKNNNNNNYYKNNNNYNNNNGFKDNNNDNSNNYGTQNNQQLTKQNLNAYVQPSIVPAILHTGIGLINNQNQQLVRNPLYITNPELNLQMFKATNDALESTMKQLQYQLANFPGSDNIGGASNNINAVNGIISPIQKAQLPILGTKNVEIINPNMNAYAINQLPATLVTTPIPIFTTTGFINPKTFSSTTQESTGVDRPMYNPINFVPNYDLLKSQSILNNNAVGSDSLTQPNLHLIPIVPGGNFYKQGEQYNSVNKPKLNPELEKYAEEMFKESLRTIYSSHKWNTDSRPRNVSLTDNSELARLRNELLRIQQNMKNSKYPKDTLEAHQTENKIRTAKPDSDYKYSDSGEQPHKNSPKPHHGPGPHSHPHPHHSQHPHHHKHKSEIRDFLTPPRPHSFHSKGPFLDKPLKKRPGHGPPPHGPRPNLHHENPRLRPRQGVAPIKSKGSEEQQSSNVVNYRHPVRFHPERPPFNAPDNRNSLNHNHNYPTFTTSSPENDYYRSSSESRSSEREVFDMNKQRTHNLMGLLMKNKQLPKGLPDNYYSNRDAVHQYFEDENRKSQVQAFDDAYNSFPTQTDRPFRPSILLGPVMRREYQTRNNRA